MGHTAVMSFLAQLRTVGEVTDKLPRILPNLSHTFKSECLCALDAFMANLAKPAHDCFYLESTSTREDAARNGRPHHIGCKEDVRAKLGTCPIDPTLPSN